MAILELRILPPLAIARLGDSDTPLEAYDLEISSRDPLGYRQIVPRQTLLVNPTTGEIEKGYTPEVIRFKDGDRVRPVAPFLEVFARVDGHHDLVPLTIDLLAAEGLSFADVKWSVRVANIKVYRRTGDPKDRIEAKVEGFADNDEHALLGQCENFFDGKSLPFGTVRYIKPTTEFPEIRLRFTPAKGAVYGASLERNTSPSTVEKDLILTEDRVIYDPSKGTWRGYAETGAWNPEYTNPAQIFAGYATDDGSQVSWGYLDDECDGIVSVELKLSNGSSLAAFSRIGAGPPAYAPDSLPIRTVFDDLEQALHGIHVHKDVPLEEAEEIVRKAFESVRLMNTAVLNGNPIDGRLDVASTMARQDTNDFGRRFEPIMAPSLVDNLTILALHQRVFTALRSGAAAWFYHVLRQPEEIGDMSDEGRRKMPALMRGADGRALTLTRRQIDTVLKAASRAMFEGPHGGDKGDAK